MKISLSDRLERFLRLKGELICGGELQKMAAAAGFEPQNAGRRLRELVNEGKLEVEYIKGQNKIKVAWYRYKTPPSIPSPIMSKQMTLV